MEPVDKDFCDERSGNILVSTKDLRNDIQRVQKAIDRMTWLVITTLVSVCGSLWASLTSQGMKCASMVKEIILSYFV